MKMDKMGVMVVVAALMSIVAKILSAIIVTKLCEINKKELEKYMIALVLLSSASATLFYMSNKGFGRMMAAQPVVHALAMVSLFANQMDIFRTLMITSIVIF